MDLLIFDMDGVLLKPRGYHLALQETVRLAGQSIGMGDVNLSDAQIAKYEALGISSEWHSSALSLAVLKMQQRAGLLGGSKGGALALDDLFDLLAEEPLENPALDRGLAAFERLSGKYGVRVDGLREDLLQCEAIDHSATMNWFQELILGSKWYSDTYGKPAQLYQESYLIQYDQRILSQDMGETIRSWSSETENGAAVMTNRPSSGPPGFAGAPDADLGIELVGLPGVPVIGYGEILWMAEAAERESGTLNKPNWVHALAAILVGSGMVLQESLVVTLRLYLDGGGDRQDELAYLAGSTISVFEDTPAGVVAVEKAGELLGGLGIPVHVQKIGVTGEASKQAALEAVGAVVFSNVNEALGSLQYFN